MANSERRRRLRTASTVAGRGSVALCLGLSAACGESEVDRQVSGRWLDVALPEDVEMCAGTLPGYDRFLEEVADRWGFELAGWRGRMEVVSPGDPGPCFDVYGSCANARRREVWLARTAAGEHELVHLIASTEGSPPAFFSEGIATYWGSRPYSGMLVDAEEAVALLESETPGELVDISAYGYLIAGGFTGRLIEKYGVERYRSFYDVLPRDASFAEIGGVFEEVFGEPLDSQLAASSVEKMCNAPIWACEHAIVTTLPFVQDGPLDCGDLDVQGFDSDVLAVHAPKQTRSFVLEEDADVELSLLGVEFVMVKCGACDEEVIQGGGFRETVDVYPERLSAGTWVVRFANRSSEDMYFGLRVLEE